MSTIPWNLELFEKEKGGVGATGSLITAAHAVMMRGGPVVFVEASVSQNDVLNAYGDFHTTYAIDLTEPEAREQLIDIVVGSQPGAHIFVNVPGGRAEELDRVHEMIAFIFEEDPAFPMEVRITWTMGLDAASRTTLDAVLATRPPGRLLLNLPAWHGTRERFVHVDAALVDAVERAGGVVFQMPALEEHLYDLFRVDQIGLDRIAALPGMTYGRKIAFSMWQRAVAATLAGIY